MTRFFVPFPRFFGAHFAVVPPPNRQKLASSGLVPQTYDFDDLEAMGMYVLFFFFPPKFPYIYFPAET
jgi:hypothetical protein